MGNIMLQKLHQAHITHSVIDEIILGPLTKKMQEGMTPGISLSQDQIRTLEELVFERSKNPISILEERLVELAAIKAKYRNCNAPKTPFSEYYSLGHWSV